MLLAYFQVFLINHHMSRELFIPIIKQVRAEFADLWIGVNFLGTPGDVAFPILGQLDAEGCHIDGYWADDACVDERNPYLQHRAQSILVARKQSGWDGLYVGGEWQPTCYSD